MVSQEVLNEAARRLVEKFHPEKIMLRVLTELKYAFDIIILTREEYERDQKIPGTIGRYASR